LRLLAVAVVIVCRSYLSRYNPGACTLIPD
jgi:hypothetical protein